MPLLQRPPFWLPPDPPRSGGVSAGAINLVDSKSGAATNTVITVTLPAYLTTDYIVLFIASNNANAQTYQANVTATNLANTGNRVSAYQIVPVDGAQTTFTVTVGTSSVFSWWIGSYRGVAAGSVYAASNAQGNSTVSALAVPAVTLGYVAAGGELALWCGGVNATATWATDANTIFSSPSANNASMMVSGHSLAPNAESYAPGSVDRGLNGTSRNQNSVALVLPASATATPNLLANASFENGATLATSWQDEHTTVGAATYSLTTTGLTDGALSQTMAYTGQGGDTGTGIIEIFQSPITGMSPGDTLEFDVWLSGSLTNCYCFIGIEGFSTGQVFISENDTNVLTLTAAPTKYTVQYLCPAGTVAVAAYLQVPSIGPTVAFSINLDQASLVKVVGTGGAQALAGQTDGASTTAADLAAAHALAGQADGAAGTIAPLAVTHSLTGTSTGASTTTAALAVAHSLTGQADGSSTTTAGAAVAHSLAGTSAGAATTTGEPVITYVLAGTSTGAAGTTTAVAVAHSLAGQATGSATTAAAAAVLHALAANADGAGGTSGSLTVVGTGPSGQADGTSTASGTLAVSHPLAGQTGGAATTVAAATVAHTLTGASSGSSSTAATVAVGNALNGQAAGAATVAGTLFVPTALSGSSDGAATAIGAVSVGLLVRLVVATLPLTDSARQVLLTTGGAPADRSSTSTTVDRTTKGSP